MRKLIIAISILLASFGAMAQNANLTIKVPSATTPFGAGIPAGTHIVNLANNDLWQVKGSTAGLAGTATIASSITDLELKGGDIDLTNLVTTNTTQTIEAFKTIKNDGGTLNLINNNASSSGSGLALYDENSTKQWQMGYNNNTNEAFMWGFNTIPFKIGVDGSERFRIDTNGQLQFNSYTSSTSFSGTPVANLQVDADGKLVTSVVGGDGDGMTYPAAGIAVSTGTAWATSKNKPDGDIVGTTDEQDLTDKTINGVELTDLGSSTKSLREDGEYYEVPFTPYWVGRSITVQNITVTSSHVISFNADNGYHAKINNAISNGFTLNMSNLQVGTTGNFTIINGLSGGVITLSTNYTNKINSSIRASTNLIVLSGISNIDMISWYYDGTYLIWNGAKEYE